MGFFVTEKEYTKKGFLGKRKPPGNVKTSAGYRRRAAIWFKNGKSPSQTYKGCKKRRQPEREISHKLLALSRGYSKYYSVSVSGSGTRNSAGSMLILERTIALSSPGRTEIMKKEPEPGEKK